MGGKVVPGDARQVRCHGLEFQCLRGSLDHGPSVFIFSRIDVIDDPS